MGQNVTRLCFFNKIRWLYPWKRVPWFSELGLVTNLMLCGGDNFITIQIVTNWSNRVTIVLHHLNTILASKLHQNRSPSWIFDFSYSTQREIKTNENFSNTNDSSSKQIFSRHEPSLKTPNLQGFLPTPNRQKVRAVQTFAIDSLQGVHQECSTSAFGVF